MYRWWVFVHLAGVFAFLAAHGVSIAVTFRLRSETDPRKVSDLLVLSGVSIRWFYVSTGVLVVAGTVAGFLGHLWAQGWIWAAIVVLVLTSAAMLLVARPYYRRVGLIARAMASGSQAVTDEQFRGVLRSRVPDAVATIGVVGLGLILYLMLFKPTLGFGAVVPTSSPAPGSIQLLAHGTAFDSSRIIVPASKPFTVVLDNQDPGVSHNVSIYTNSSATKSLFTGALIVGPKTIAYHVGPIAPGTYFFRCDVHPTQMTGTVVAGAGTGT